MKKYDYILIGTGSGLLIISELLKQKKKIAIIEQNYFGGDEIYDKGIINGGGLNPYYVPPETPGDKCTHQVIELPWENIDKYAFTSSNGWIHG